MRYKKAIFPLAGAENGLFYSKLSPSRCVNTCPAENGALPISKKLPAPRPAEWRATMIEVKNLVKQYGANRAVDNVSFTVNQGEILGFLWTAR